jgi:hypothetical protein
MLQTQPRTSRQSSSKQAGQIFQIPADTDPLPFYLRVQMAAHRTGLSRTRLFQLIAEGKINSKYITKTGNKRGFRLIETASLLDYINSFGS